MRLLTRPAEGNMPTFVALKVILISLLLMLSAHFLQAQKQSYVLYNGTVITPSYTSFSNPKKGVAYFTFDDQYIVEIPAVKYIEYDTVRYRLAGLFKGNIQYRKRILNGPRIDIYSQEYKKTRLSPFKNRENNKVDYFFEKNEESLRTIGYNNLRWAVADDPESAAHLKKARKYRWIQFASVALGSWAAIAAIQREDFRTPASLASVSILSLIPIALSQKPKREILYETIDIYNRPR
ncbi:MAG: hypothetical protein AAGA85_27625 [Bacteroidota bacterium]